MIWGVGIERKQESPFRHIKFQTPKSYLSGVVKGRLQLGENSRAEV